MTHTAQHLDPSVQARRAWWSLLLLAVSFVATFLAQNLLGLVAQIALGAVPR